MNLKHKEKNDLGDDGDEEFDFYVKYRGVSGVDAVDLGVKEGERVKDVLGRMKFTYAAGLTYKLNNQRLEVDAKTGELADNPILQDGDLLAIQQTVIGGI